MRYPFGLQITSRDEQPCLEPRPDRSFLAIFAVQDDHARWAVSGATIGEGPVGIQAGAEFGSEGAKRRLASFPLRDFLAV